MSFEDTMKHVEEMEGGWANNPADSGGETFRGIARNFHKSWPGWAIDRRGPKVRRYHGQTH
jgi:lysozyme family protein